MSKDLWMVQPGVLAETRTFADEQEHTFHFKVRTPPELTDFYARLAELGESTTTENSKKRLELYAKFISDSLCNEDGSQLMTPAECQMIPAGLRVELRDIITARSQNQIAKLGKT